MVGKREVMRFLPVSPSFRRNPEGDPSSVANFTSRWAKPMVKWLFGWNVEHRNYWSFVYSAFACFRTGIQKLERLAGRCHRTDRWALTNELLPMLYVSRRIPC
jgi:hypothetical protein